MNDFFTWWQNLPFILDPTAFSVVGLEVKWYGLMYLAAFLTTFFLVKHRVKNEERFGKYDEDFIIDLFTWTILGLLLGGRIGYVVFYNFDYFWKNPIEIIWPFSGGEFTGIAGMSYHGGLIGAIIFGSIFVWKRRDSFLRLADLIAPAAPLGYTFGRLGNFINGELWGRPTTSDIGMLFPSSAETPGEMVLRHPSQLYEAFFEGIVLFLLLWSIRKLAGKTVALPEGSMIGLYLIGYGVARFFIEFFREPDWHMGFVIGSFSMGQILSATMILAGILWYAVLRIKNINVGKLV